MQCKDACTHIKYLADCGDESCQGCYGEEDHCLLLEGLAGATNLELISQYSVIFRKDLKWCPMFSKLKTVLLNEWCLTANFTGLLYFLQHAPILEKLTLQLPSCKDFDIGSNGSYSPAEYFLVSKHLKVVEIHCSKEDEWTCQIVNILGTHGVTSVRNREDEWICQIVNILGIHGVTSAQISIKHDSRNSFRFSFQQTK
ncbi:uncharacterized protein LOC119280591 [Triticum dicoccoides]|uniref:uncharacterized protein LOC119280591 n=1 Tax=Triticum dicoccoides TaxID=85692 RepID=UPI00188EEDD5|nr:uncharacterized protein LOC119280591 [Triticum dicoccoides]XP_044343893.1 uncharacterized protein LOC123064481 [Triticum aestivum]